MLQAQQLIRSSHRNTTYGHPTHRSCRSHRRHPLAVRQCQADFCDATTSAAAVSASHTQSTTPINVGPNFASNKLSRRGSLAAAANILVASIPSNGWAAAEEQAGSASTTPVENLGIGEGAGRLPPLADRPGASGKQLLIDPQEFTYTFVSEVPCDLRVKQYYELIVKNRPKCWQRIAAQIQAGNFVGLEEGLKADAMADLRQAALFTPWALLQRDDYVAAVEVRKGYLSLNAHIQDLQNAALVAAEGGDNMNPGAERVQQAFILMSASLDDFLSRIPKKYKEGPQGPQD